MNTGIAALTTACVASVVCAVGGVVAIGLSGFLVATDLGNISERGLNPGNTLDLATDFAGILAPGIGGENVGIASDLVTGVGDFVAVAAGLELKVRVLKLMVSSSSASARSSQALMRP